MITLYNLLSFTEKREAVMRLYEAPKKDLQDYTLNELRQFHCTGIFRYAVLLQTIHELNTRYHKRIDEKIGTLLP